MAQTCTCSYAYTYTTSTYTTHTLRDRDRSRGRKGGWDSSHHSVMNCKLFPDIFVTEACLSPRYRMVTMASWRDTLCDLFCSHWWIYILDSCPPLALTFSLSESAWHCSVVHSHACLVLPSFNFLSSCENTCRARVPLIPSLSPTGTSAYRYPTTFLIHHPELKLTVSS